MLGASDYSSPFESLRGLTDWNVLLYYFECLVGEW